MLDIATVSRVMPPNLRSAVTQSFVDKLNAIGADPVEAEAIRDNFMSYTKVLSEGRFKTEDYLNAVTYVSLKLMGHSNQDAYIRTFPDRYKDMLAAGKTAKEISSMVAAYNKGMLVNKILEQTLVPSWVLNADIYQKAINTQAELMLNASSEMVRTQAANSILTHLAKPKDTAPLINFDMRNDSGINELRDTLTQLAQQQQQLISAGVSPRDIAGQKLVRQDEDVTDV